MQGLELSRLLYEAIADDLFAGDLSCLRDRCAIGLVGEGSECFGFDDERSRDHDWGPSLCLWLEDDDLARHGETLQARYLELTAQPFMGFASRPAQPAGVPRRVGVRGVGAFYASLLGRDAPPATLEDWREIPETGLAAATNGEVFCDPLGTFTAVRTQLLAYYPEDLRIKKIAGACMHAGQAGQYNFPGQAMRGEDLAAFSALARFQDAAIRICYALARRYLIFYKWAPRGLAALGDLGETLQGKLGLTLTSYQDGNLRAATVHIEEICSAIAAEMRAQGLSTSVDPFLITQGIEANGRVGDETLRSADIMSF